jgi:arylsulfatase A-like enzyme
LDRTGQETSVMIISDHGAQAAENAREGAAWTIRSENLLKMLGLWGRVSAVNIGFHLYLSPKDERPEARDELAGIFRGIVEDETGQPVFEVIPMEHSYLKVMALEGRLEKLRGKTVRVGERSCRFEDLVEISTGRLSGAHHPEGICILQGPQIRKGVRLNPANLLDVTPTALMLMGLPVAEDMPGRPLTEAVSEAYRRSYSSNRCPTYEDGQRTEGDENKEEPMSEDLIKQLKALGYLG